MKTRTSPAGQVPIEWDVMPLSKVAMVSYGISTPINRSLNDGTRIISLPNVTKQGSFNLENVPFVETEKVQQKDILKKGDILFNWRNGSKDHIGKTVLFDLDGVYTHVGFLLKIASRENINPFYLDIYLKYIKSRDFFMGSKIQVNSTFNKEELNAVPVVVPPLLEQCKIAEILGVWDESIDLLERLIGKTRSRKQGLMQQLLTGKKRFKEFEGSEWKTMKLGAVCKFIKDGTHSTHERLEDGIPLLSATNITKSGQVCFDNASLISKEDYEKIHAKYKIQDRDFLLTVVGTLGRSALVKNLPRFTLQRSVAIIRVDESKIKPIYLYCFSKSSEFQNQLKNRANITAQAGVYLGELGKITLRLPPLPEQEKIAAVLSAADEEISTLEKQLAAYKQQKLGLMQQLLTGKIRV